MHTGLQLGRSRWVQAVPYVHPAGQHYGQAWTKLLQAMPLPHSQSVKLSISFKWLFSGSDAAVARYRDWSCSLCWPLFVGSCTLLHLSEIWIWAAPKSWDDFLVHQIFCGFLLRQSPIQVTSCSLHSGGTKAPQLGPAEEIPEDLAAGHPAESQGEDVSGWGLLFPYVTEMGLQELAKGWSAPQ